MATFIWPPTAVTVSGSALESTQLQVLAELDSIETTLTSGQVEVTAVDLDIRDLNSATDSVTVVATNLDVRDLNSASDSVAAVQSGTWNINNVSGTVSLPTGAATAANQTAMLARLSGSLVPAAYDYIALTYVAAGNGAGEIETAVYKTGGSGETTVKTLTLAYNSDNKLTSVTAS